MNRFITYSCLLLMYLTCTMPLYIHSMETRTEHLARKVAQLRLRKQHLNDDITQYARALKERQNNRDIADDMYPYWRKQHPYDSLQDYIAILDQRITQIQQLLDQRRQELDTVLQELNDIDVMFKEKEENGESKNSHEPRKPSKM